MRTRCIIGAGLGVIAVAAGVVLGFVFVSSDEFAFGFVSCDPDNSEIATPANCANNQVLGVDGSVCQVGNLGLFKASFTPECTYGTAYEINRLLPGSVNIDPLAFGPLFPAQTNFGGIGDNLGFPTAFKGCSAYFNDEATISGFKNLAVRTLNETLDGLRNATKQKYDEGLANNLARVDVNFQNAYLAVEQQFIDGGLSTNDITLVPTDVSLNVLNLPQDWLTFTATLGLLSADAATANAAIDASLTNAPSGIVDTEGLLEYGVAVGTEYDIVGTPGDTIPGVSPFGLWSSFNSGILCSGSPCTHVEFLIIAQSSTTDPETLQSLGLLLQLLSDYETRILQRPDIVTALEAASQTLDRAGIQAAIGEYKIVELGGTETDPALHAAGATIFDLAFSGEALLANLQNDLRFVDAIPNSLFTPAEDENQAFGLVCIGVDLPANCKIGDVVQAGIDPIQALEPSNRTAEENETLASGLLVILILDQCELEGATLLEECLLATTTVDLPGRGVPLELAVFGLLDSFYDLQPNRTMQEYIDEAIVQCEDDDLTMAALRQAQVLIPIGVAFSIVGCVGTILGLVVYLKRQDTGKMSALLAGLASVLGVALVLVALIGIVLSPIYQQIGSNAPPVDNKSVFATGPGRDLAFAFIGVLLTGSVLLVLSACLLPSSGKNVSKPVGSWRIMRYSTNRTTKPQRQHEDSTEMIAFNPVFQSTGAGNIRDSDSLRTDFF